MAISSKLNYAYTCAALANSCSLKVRGWVVAYSKGEKRGGEIKEERHRAHTHSGVNHPKSNRLRAPAGDLQQTARGVYWRLRLATATTDASENRFRRLGREFSGARERAPKFPPWLFTPHIVRFDERKRRRADLWPAISPCPRPRSRNRSSRRRLH